MTQENSPPNKKEKQQEAEKLEEQIKSWIYGWSVDIEEVRVDTNKALIGGFLAALTTLAGAWIVGEASGMESYNLLETSLSTTRSFSGTITLALGNILALMLTLLSLSAATNINLKWAHYQRVKQIAWFTACTLVLSILVYLLLNFPLSEADGKSVPWYRYLYYSTLGITSLLGGALITIVLMLYNTVKDIILVLSPKGGHEHLIFEEEEEENKEKTNDY